MTEDLLVYEELDLLLKTIKEDDFNGYIKNDMVNSLKDIQDLINIKQKRKIDLSEEEDKEDYDKIVNQTNKLVNITEGEIHLNNKEEHLEDIKNIIEQNENIEDAIQTQNVRALNIKEEQVLLEPNEVDKIILDKEDFIRENDIENINDIEELTDALELFNPEIEEKDSKELNELIVDRNNVLKEFKVMKNRVNRHTKDLNKLKKKNKGYIAVEIKQNITFVRIIENELVGEAHLGFNDNELDLFKDIIDTHKIANKINELFKSKPITIKYNRHGKDYSTKVVFFNYFDYSGKGTSRLLNNDDFMYFISENARVYKINVVKPTLITETGIIELIALQRYFKAIQGIYHHHLMGWAFQIENKEDNKVYFPGINGYQLDHIGDKIKPTVIFNKEDIVASKLAKRYNNSLNNLRLITGDENSKVRNQKGNRNRANELLIGLIDVFKLENKNYDSKLMVEILLLVNEVYKTI